MNSTRLGRTGLQVSRICLGTMTFGLQCDEETSRAILDTAAEGGVTFIDTADVYPLGATKCVGVTGPRRWERGASRRHVMDAVEASLRRLGTDYIDLYQLHSYD